MYTAQATPIHVGAPGVGVGAVQGDLRARDAVHHHGERHHAVVDDVHRVHPVVGGRVRRDEKQLVGAAPGGVAAGQVSSAGGGGAHIMRGIVKHHPARGHGHGGVAVDDKVAGRLQPAHRSIGGVGGGGQVVVVHRGRSGACVIGVAQDLAGGLHRIGGRVAAQEGPLGPSPPRQIAVHRGGGIGPRQGDGIAAVVVVEPPRLPKHPRQVRGVGIQGGLLGLREEGQRAGKEKRQKGTLHGITGVGDDKSLAQDSPNGQAKRRAPRFPSSAAGGMAMVA